MVNINELSVKQCQYQMCLCFAVKVKLFLSSLLILYLFWDSLKYRIIDFSLENEDITYQAKSYRIGK